MSDEKFSAKYWNFMNVPKQTIIVNQSLDFELHKLFLEKNNKIIEYYSPVYELEWLKENLADNYALIIAFKSATNGRVISYFQGEKADYRLVTQDRIIKRYDPIDFDAAAERVLKN